MTNHEKLLEQYEDALFALMMESVAETEGEKALELNAQLQADPEAAMPEELQRRCEKTMQTAFAKRNAKKSRRKAWKILRVVVAAVLLLSLLFTTAFAVSEDFRIATLNAVIQVFENRTQITFEDSTPTEIDGLVYQYNIALEWLPEGYEVEGGWTTKRGDGIAYINDIGCTIDIDFTRYGEGGGTYNFDTEDSEKKIITVQGHQAELYIKNEDALRQRFATMPQIWSKMIVFWIDESREVIVLIAATNFTEDEMIRFVNGVHWCG